MYNDKYKCHMAACSTCHRPTIISQQCNKSYTKQKQKKTGEWATSRKKEKTERATGPGGTTGEMERKLESNDSPQILDKRETPNSLGLTTEKQQQQQKTTTKIIIKLQNTNTH